MNKIGHILRGVLCALAAFAVFSSCEQPNAPGSLFIPPPVPEPPPDLRPAAPAAPRVIAGDGLITVIWNPVENAGEYEVYLSNGTTPPEAPSRAVSGSPAVVSDLPNKTPHYVWLKAKNEHGASGFSPYGYGTPWPSGEAPQTPGQPTVSAGVDQLTVQWDAAGGASEYEIYINTTPTPPSSPAVTTGNTSGTIYSLQNGTMYVWVKAVNAAGSSDFSPAAAGIPKTSDALPAVPSKPVLAARNQGIAVSWTAVDMASAYEVWISTSADSSAAEKQAEVNGNTLQAIIGGLTNGTAYHVWIKAKNSYGASEFSEGASAEPSAFIETPAAPGSAPVVTPGNGRLTISWDAVDGAAGYEVWKNNQENLASAAKHGGDITATSTDITGLTNGTIYYFWIKAKNSAGTSEASPVASGMPEISVAGQTPAVPAISIGDSQLTITWTALPGAAVYEIWMAQTNNTGSASKQGGDITGTLSATISGLTNGTTYYLWVKARNFTGESNFSPAAAGRPIATPGAPTLTAENGQLTAAWTAVTGADEYEVYYGIGSAVTLSGTVSGTSAVITGLTNGTMYQVRLRGKNETGLSAYGPSAGGTPQISAGLYKGASPQGAVKIGDQNLADSLTYISTNAVIGDNYYIVLGANESAAPKNLGFSGKTIGITLMGTGGERQIALNTAGSLFTVNTGVTLTLDDKITLVGRASNSASLVTVNSGGFLVMNTGSKITGNRTSSSFCSGGVYVSGTFTMKGGEISSNATSYSGGGVYVYSDGAFTMEGGEISNNAASSSGGGVCVYSDGAFTMEGGEISNNAASSSGGGVCVSGTFTMEGGEISGNTASSGGGGGVLVSSDGFFTKTSAGGIVYGNNASPVSLRNSAAGRGDAVYRLPNGKRRNSTIAANEAFNSSQSTGWDN
ncbi:MAG: fibronectin type III domain-containing protein [Treponema sp.]|jgi:hypothetical protein|nr:fibronectin type III domain-containing protein [Treponema sp.]